MAKFRKKPVVIEAMQFTQESVDEIDKWLEGHGVEFGWQGLPGLGKTTALLIKTLESKGADRMTADVGDWIIKGVKGEFYPCKPDIFAATYEPADIPAPPNTRRKGE